MNELMSGYTSNDPPNGYVKIHGNLICRCINSWRDENGEGWCKHCGLEEKLIKAEAGEWAAGKYVEPKTRRYLPTLPDLVDRLTIINQKAIFILEHREEYIAERADILHDIDLILADLPQLNAQAILAITMIQLTNRYIWENESKARQGGTEQDRLLKATHSINGIRNGAKNLLAEQVGGRRDYKLDCFAAELVEQFGNWNVLK